MTQNPHLVLLYSVNFNLTNIPYIFEVVILPPNSSDTKHNAMGPTGDLHATQHAVDTADCNILWLYVLKHVKSGTGIRY